jgi:Ca2+-transporting ATPase
MAQWYGLTQEEVLKRLGTNRTGLNEKEAERRLETYGENVLKEQEEMPWWQVFLGQFKDLLVMILIGAAGVSMVTGDPESALVIFSVLLLNAILGTVEHQKARKSLESLKRLASPETLLIRKEQSKRRKHRWRCMFRRCSISKKWACLRSITVTTSVRWH